MEEGDIERDTDYTHYFQIHKFQDSNIMNEVSIIINGVRYDAEPVPTNSPLTDECIYCDLLKEDGTSECIKLSHCPLFPGYFFKKHTKSFERSNG